MRQAVFPTRSAALTYRAGALSAAAFLMHRSADLSCTRRHPATAGGACIRFFSKMI